MSVPFSSEAQKLEKRLVLAFPNLTMDLSILQDVEKRRSRYVSGIREAVMVGIFSCRLSSLSWLSGFYLWAMID